MNWIGSGTVVTALLMLAGSAGAAPMWDLDVSRVGQGDQPQSHPLTMAQSDEPTSPKGEAGEPSAEPGSAAEPDEPGSQAGGEEPEKPEQAVPVSGEEPEKPEQAAPAAPAATVAQQATPSAQYGVGLHVRAMFVPTWVLNLFLDRSTPLNSAAFGAEVVRRKGTLDIIGSIDFGFYSPINGNYLSKGGNPAEDTDYLDFRGLSALAFTVALIRHEQILPWLSFVWGGGLGLGIVLGNIYRASSSPACTYDNIGDLRQCHPIGMDPQDPQRWLNDAANQGTEAEDSPGSPKVYREDSVPPVVPVVHLLVGFNFKISEQFSVRVDGGFRNAFYVGTTGHYFF